MTAEEQLDKVLELYKKYDNLIRTAPGSSHNHQAWEGGYMDHISECVSIAEKLYEGLEKIRPVPFSVEEAVIVILLHDIEKPFKYSKNEPKSFKTKKQRKDFREKLIAEIGLELSDEQQNALQYTEGENTKYSPKERKMLPMGAFVHACDVISARLWWDQPKQLDD